MPCPAGHQFDDVFPLKQGMYSDLPAATISEMMRSNNLDGASTESLLTVMKGILDESIERQNGEIPRRVAFLLKNVVHEIERCISTQAEQLQNQNNHIKACEEKCQSRIRVLETLASGTTEETKVIRDQLQLIKVVPFLKLVTDFGQMAPEEKIKIEQSKKLMEQDLIRLRKENEASIHKVSELQKNLETTKKFYERQCHFSEAKANLTKVKLGENIKELELLLAESRKTIRKLEEFSESKLQSWNQKQYVFQNIISLQLQAMKASSKSIKHEVTSTKQRLSEEFYSFGKKLKVLTDAAENYHVVIAENRKLFNEVQELKGNIRVYCRVRPFLAGENRKSTTVDYIGEDGELILVNPSKQGKDGHRTFKFSKVFGPAATQEEVFLDIQPLIRSVLDGYNVCIFAYGQTGSGKTYTMTGPNSSSEEDWGVNYRALNDLFHISRIRRNTIMYEVGVQMVEIYNEQVRDLLVNNTSQKKLGVLNASQPNGLAVPDAVMYSVNSTTDVLKLMQIGLANRAVGSTALNERSSRSHSIVTVHVRGVDIKTSSTLRGSLHLVDLAGSERVDRSEVTGDRLREAQHINKSLSALGDVIFSLSQKNSRVPYRNSKLTQVLQSSLGGHAKTLMFVQINPDVKSYSETCSTLKFAERVSGVELGAAWSNKESNGVRDLMEQVASLKKAIARKDDEIDRLQKSKDVGNRSPRVRERQGDNKLRHSSSSPGLSLLGAPIQHDRRLSVRKGSLSSSRAASEAGNSSDHSDKYSEASSQQSMDDFRHHKEYLGLSKLSGEDACQHSSADIELLGFGDADSDERLSDISDSCLSMGTETDCSINSIVEFSLFPEHGQTMEVTKERSPEVPSQISRPNPQKVVQQPTSGKTKGKEILQSSSLRRSTASQTTASSPNFSKRWLQ